MRTGKGENVKGAGEVPGPPIERTLRVLSYNIHKCIGGIDRRYRPERIAEIILHYSPDIVLLQEVDNGTRRSRRDRQIDLLAQRTGFGHALYRENVRVRGGGAYGNGILSRYPIYEGKNIDLTIGWRKRRSVLHAALNVPLPTGGGERRIHVFNLHLGLTGGERRRQLHRFFESHPFAGLHASTPLVVGGDFNDLGGRLARSVFGPAGFILPPRPVRTFPAYAPMQPLDAIYLRGPASLEKYYRSHLKTALTASDHLPLFAEIRLFSERSSKAGHVKN